MEKCIFCGAVSSYSGGANKWMVHCENCGIYIFDNNEDDIAFLKAHKHIFAGYLYEHNRSEDVRNETKKSATLTKNFLDDKDYPKNIPQKLDKLLLFLNSQNDYFGKEYEFNTSNPPAISYAKNDMEFENMCLEMKRLKWIDNYKKDVLGNIYFMLSVSGISHAEKLLSAATSAKADIKYDIFICHSSEDKKAFVDPFNAELESKGITAFYDKVSIAWGESIVRKINEGLAQSKIGVIVISDDFMKKEWPNTEIDALINLMINNNKRLLPILHNISYENMAQKYPLIASLSCRDSSKKSISEMVNEISIILNYLN